jgi:hypothetical protein
MAALVLEIGLALHTGWKTGCLPEAVWVQGMLRHTYKILFWKPEEKRLLRKPKHTWENSKLKGY